MPKFRLTLSQRTAPMDKVSKIIQRILEEVIELPVRVSPGIWDGDLTTYLLEVPIPMSRPRIEVALGRFRRQTGKVIAVDVASKKWRLALIAPCSKKAMEAAQLYTKAHKSVNYEMLTVKGKNLTLVMGFDDNIDRDTVVGLALDIPGINQAKLVEVKIVG